MSTLSKELVFLILQFCNEEGFKQTARMLESESGFYFDMGYFEEMMLSGNWHEAERYLSGFTKLDDNRYSTKIYFEIRKQKFFETLDRKERAMALNILMTDLKVFEHGNEELFKEMAQLLTFDNIRDHESLSLYGDTKSVRETITQEVKKLIEANPLFHGKLNFPTIKSQRLRRLINQSLNWQHILCEYPSPNPDIETLYVDHVCPRNEFSFVESIGSYLNPSQATSSSIVTHSESGGPSPSTITHFAFPLKATPTNLATEHLEDSDISFKDLGGLDEVVSLIRDPGQSPNLEPSMNIDVPTTVALTLTEGSCPTSMEFHPIKQTFLLVGTSVGDVGLWDVAQGKKLLSRNFRVWDIGACSMAFKASLVKDPCVSVNQIMWSPDGSLFGVAYSKHVVQLYSYSGGENIRQQLEIDAHLGSVNDLAFSSPNDQHLVITCGHDKTIKVWDVVTGNRQFIFEGHETPVYSLCSHTKENIDFLFSLSVDGKIKAWLYDNIGARIDYDAPGLACTRMAYSADGRRLFSCGTNKEGESFLVEWNDSEGCIRRMYQGLTLCPSAVVQFVTIKNQLLAAGDEHVIKFWDMDKKELLMTIDTGGELPVAPCISVNKDCTLLAVIANENRIKILAAHDGLHLLQTTEEHSVDDSRQISETQKKLAIALDSTAGNAESAERDILKSALKRRSCISLGSTDLLIANPKLSAHLKADEISRLTYTNSGNAILALASNAIHLLWKWPQDESNPNGKATAKVQPELWQPKSGLQLMRNDLTGSKPGDAVPCFALSKNDSYLLSASGGIISLFNMITFKTMITMMPPPPAATCIAFHPKDNNIVAIGMDNSTILIYNVRTNKVKAKLEGHMERVTGLAFSNTLKLLISSGADKQIFTWNDDGWKMEKTRFLQVPYGKELEVKSDTHIQIHQDQLHFLAVCKTHLAIYGVQDLVCVKQWKISGTAPISHATFSCDGQTIYAGFLDGTIAIFDALVLEVQYQVHPSAYLPAISWPAYPVVVAAHPQKPAQFAVGLANGEVYVLEPLDPEGKWGIGLSVENMTENY